jgi:hypothetical protein
LEGGYWKELKERKGKEKWISEETKNHGRKE